MVKIIDGVAYAKKLKELIKLEISELSQPRKPGLAIIQVGDNPASDIYVATKIKQAGELGIHARHYHLDSQVSEKHVIDLIQILNHDANIHGIIVQLPLPKHMNPQLILDRVSPIKDVDGLTVTNAGLLSKGLEGVVPCTPLGCMLLLRTLVEDFAGLHAVVVGCSNLVGKPMAQMLLRHSCTVTSIHKKTLHPELITRQADILVVAAGHPKLVKSDWVKSGAIVLDIGINRLEDETITGDTDFEGLKKKVAAITPVPGGVGPMTVACLLLNTTLAMMKKQQLAFNHLKPFTGLHVPCL